MPPGDKIPVNKTGSKDYCRSPACPYCGFPRSWKHGKYRRKGFHRKHQTGPQEEPVAVQRYLCRSSPCDRTFSDLPEGVLPYCRFYLDGLLSVSQDLTEGKSCYRIAKFRWDLSLRIILRAVLLIRKVTPWLEGVCREAVGIAGSGFQALVKTVREKFSWFDFTRRWFHGLYPCRAGNIINPHNLGIKRL